MPGGFEARALTALTPQPPGGHLNHRAALPRLRRALASRRPNVPADEVREQVAAINRLIDRHLTLAASGAGDTRWIDVPPRLEAVLGLMRHLGNGIDEVVDRHPFRQLRRFVGAQLDSNPLLLPLVEHAKLVDVVGETADVRRQRGLETPDHPARVHQCGGNALGEPIPEPLRVSDMPK